MYRDGNVALFLGGVTQQRLHLVLQVAVVLYTYRYGCDGGTYNQRPPQKLQEHTRTEGHAEQQYQQHEIADSNKQNQS